MAAEAPDVPELTSDPTREDVTACADAIASLISKGEKDNELLASEYGNSKDALSAWRSAYKVAPEKTLKVISSLLKPEEADPIKRMLTLQLPLLLKETPDRGRFFTSRDVLDQGRSVFFEHPYILTIDDGYLRKNCHHCCQPLKEGTAIFCQCGMAAYCSSQCSHAGGYYHDGIECGILSKLGGAVTLLTNTRDLRMLVRLIVRRQLEAKQKALLHRTSTFKDFMSLVSHITAIPEAAKDTFKTMWGILSHLLPKELVPTVDEVIQWSARIRSNMHSVSWLDAKEGGVNLNLFGQIVNANPEVGAAIYPGISMFNHSCRPNCIFVTRGAAAAEVFTITKIAPANELTVAYINTALPLAERRRRLKEKYNFDCKCARCTEEEKRGDTTQTSTTTTPTSTSSASTGAAPSKIVCGECGAAREKLLLCGRCRNVAYCSGDCQRKHWPVHKPNCAAAAAP